MASSVNSGTRVSRDNGDDVVSIFRPSTIDAHCIEVAGTRCLTGHRTCDILFYSSVFQHLVCYCEIAALTEHPVYIQQLLTAGLLCFRIDFSCGVKFLLKQSLCVISAVAVGQVYAITQHRGQVLLIERRLKHAVFVRGLLSRGIFYLLYILLPQPGYAQHLERISTLHHTSHRVDDSTLPRSIPLTSHVVE